MENTPKDTRGEDVRARLASVLQETFVYLPADVAARVIAEQDKQDRQQFDALFPGNKVTFLRNLRDAQVSYNVAV